MSQPSPITDDYLGAALIDHVWGQQLLAGSPMSTTLGIDRKKDRLDEVALGLVGQIYEREEHLELRRAALAVFVARYMDAVTGILDEVDRISEVLAERLAPAQDARPAHHPITTGWREFAAGPDPRPAAEAAREPEVIGPWNDFSVPHAGPPTAPIIEPLSGERPDDTPVDLEAVFVADEIDLRADYRRLAKVIAPDLGAQDDPDDQARRTDLLARLTAAYRAGNAAAMAMVEIEIRAALGPDAQCLQDADDDETASRARLERTCAALTARLAEVEAEIRALDGSSMDQLRRESEASEAVGHDFLRHHVAGMHDQTAQIRANLEGMDHA